MRAWSIRKLGPGSTIKSFSNETAPDRFGDIRLEANLEYRYYLTKLVGFPLKVLCLPISAMYGSFARTKIFPMANLTSGDYGQTLAWV